MSENRAPRGTSQGGQFVASERPRADVRLVEFASDEAAQVAVALANFETYQAHPGPAHEAARRQVVMLREKFTSSRPFVAAEFDSDQVAAMHAALVFHRDRSSSPAVGAALFRLETAVPAEGA